MSSFGGVLFTYPAPPELPVTGVDALRHMAFGAHGVYSEQEIMKTIAEYGAGWAVQAFLSQVLRGFPRPDTLPDELLETLLRFYGRLQRGQEDQWLTQIRLLKLMLDQNYFIQMGLRNEQDFIRLLRAIDPAVTDTSSGVPPATMRPPFSPPSGPISIT